MFSRSIDKFENLNTSKFVRFKPSSLMSSNLVAQRRKSGFARNPSIHFILPPQNQEILRDKINIITEDVDVLIGSHKNYAFNLNTLIETAFIENNRQSNQDNSNDNKDLLFKAQFPGLNTPACRRSSHSHIFNLQRPKVQPIIAPAANKISFNVLCDEKNVFFKENQ